MCNELEQAGLKAPAYYTNAFMLQTVIYNSDARKAIVEKSAIEIIKSAIEQKKYNEPSRMNILKVYEQIEKNQIFGSKEIEEILRCSSSTARAVLSKLKEMEIVTEVKGNGKGKYVFIE